MLKDCAVDQLSLEAAQPRLDPRILELIPAKTLIWGVVDNADPKVETADLVAERIRAALRISSRSASCRRPTAA